MTVDKNLQFRSSFGFLFIGLKLISLTPIPHLASLPNSPKVGFFLTIYKVYNNAYRMRLLRTLKGIVSDSHFLSQPHIEEGSICVVPSTLLLQGWTEL